MDDPEIYYIKADILHNFMIEVFKGLGVPEEEAEIIADVLITSDMRGIESHGVQRFKMYYDRIRAGIYEPTTKIDVIKDGPTTALWDGNNGMGMSSPIKPCRMLSKKQKNMD